MILSIINHDQGVASPSAIQCIQMFNKLADKVNECVAVSLTLVDNIEELPLTAHCCDDIDSA